MPLDSGDDRVAFDKTATVATLNAKLSSGQAEITLIEETSMMTVLVNTIGISIVTTGTFLATLYASWLPETMKIWIPYSFFFAMAVACVGAGFMEIKRSKVTAQERKCAQYERSLRAHGVRLPVWEYIDDDGKDVVESDAPITMVGLAMLAVWLLWSVPEMLGIIRAVGMSAAMILIPVSFLIGWLVALGISAARPEDRPIRFGFKVWIMLSVVTALGVVLVTLHEQFNVLKDLLPFIKLQA